MGVGEVNLLQDNYCVPRFSEKSGPWGWSYFLPSPITPPLGTLYPFPSTGRRTGISRRLLGGGGGVPLVHPGWICASSGGAPSVNPRQGLPKTPYSGPNVLGGIGTSGSLPSSISCTPPMSAPRGVTGLSDHANCIYDVVTHTRPFKERCEVDECPFQLIIPCWQ